METGVPCFIADVHLGKLAKALRLLGFDVLYHNTFANATLLSIAAAQHRILLSRNNAFARNGSVHAFIIQSENPEEQVQQMVQQLSLKDKFRPFT